MNTRQVAEAARGASKKLTVATTQEKNGALLAMAELLESRKRDIVAANVADMVEVKAKGITGPLYTRLKFDELKIDGRIRSLKKIAALPDPVGQTIRSDLRPNGLQATRVRVPLGVIMMIYEARPHATVNAGAFCLKSGNAAILKGGPEAKRCNTLLDELWRAVVGKAGLPEKSIQVVSATFEETYELLGMSDLIDLVIPRGGPGLIKAVTEKSRIPVIKHFQGICHVYIDESADRAKALDIALDSKLLLPAVCNTAEALLMHSSLIDWMPQLLGELDKYGVEIRGDEQVCKAFPKAKAATKDDWGHEFLGTIYFVRVVDSVDEAVEHVNRYGSGHTDSIVTESLDSARKWANGVDSGVVLVNASTMYCDGESLGMGAEIGISTDRLHARGPMGLEELTTYKHVIWGEGQVMGTAEDWKTAGG